MKPLRQQIMKLETPEYEYGLYTYSLFYQVFWRHWEKTRIWLYVNDEGKWKLTATRGISTECKCGSDYRTDNGSEFKRAFPNLGLSKMEAVLDTFHSPALCERCFYLKEWQDPGRRHLIPTRWKEKFAQNP